MKKRRLKKLTTPCMANKDIEKMKNRLQSMSLRIEQNEANQTQGVNLISLLCFTVKGGNCSIF